MNLRKETTVVITGHLSEGRSVFQTITLASDVDAPSAVIIGQAFKLIASVGGLSTSSVGNDEMDFYPLNTFSRINFAVKPIQIAQGLSLS